ncbi:MAG: hypothetical protein ACI3ZT_05720 [Candidatus Cryptobacteroides sp.]
MRKAIELISAFWTIFLAVSLCPASAEGCYEDRDSHDRMKAERVAYLTSVMELTPAEAEKFWPVYNEMERERKEAFRRVITAYKALDEALKANKPDKEISSLLDKYVSEMKDSRNLEAKYTPIFRKIISVEKVAKLFVGEEEYRRMQINRWGDKGRN